MRISPAEELSHIHTHVQDNRGKGAYRYSDKDSSRFMNSKTMLVTLKTESTTKLHNFGRQVY